MAPPPRPADRTISTAKWFIEMHLRQRGSTWWPKRERQSIRCGIGVRKFNSLSSVEGPMPNVTCPKGDKILHEEEIDFLKLLAEQSECGISEWSAPQGTISPIVKRFVEYGFLFETRDPIMIGRLSRSIAGSCKASEDSTINDLTHQELTCPERERRPQRPFTVTLTETAGILPTAPADQQGRWRQRRTNRGRRQHQKCIDC